MKQNTFKSTLALVAIAILTACGSDELPADPSFDQDIKTELVDKSQLPEWLAMARPIMNCILLRRQ